MTETSPTTVEDVDILIVGAGPVGMTLHLALAAGGLRSRLIDRRPGSALLGDPRALALSHGARELLEKIEAWPMRAATPIETIHVSQRGGFGRTLIDRDDYRLPALGYVLRYRDLAAALQARLAPDAVLADTCIRESRACTDAAGEGLLVTLQQGEHTHVLRCRLLVHAEGTPGEEQGVSVSDYGQQAVICDVQTSTGHQRRAWERFTPDGPLALLPLEQGFSIVFTLPPDQARQVLELDDTAFLARLQQQFGPRIRFTQAGPRSCFPLALRLRDTLARGREVWVGNSAQTLHPVSGQGFNLGLRDAWELADCLLDPMQRDVDLAQRLPAYTQRRKLDRQGSAFFTDQVVKAFSNDMPALRVARGLGLLALDLFPPARHFVAKRMIWGARAWP